MEEETEALRACVICQGHTARKWQSWVWVWTLWLQTPCSEPPRCAVPTFLCAPQPLLTNQQPGALIPRACIEQVRGEDEGEGLTESWHRSSMGWSVHGFPAFRGIWITSSFLPSHPISHNICKHSFTALISPASGPLWSLISPGLELSTHTSLSLFLKKILISKKIPFTG